jgi:hypothetical protein
MGYTGLYIKYYRELKYKFYRTRTSYFHVAAPHGRVQCGAVHVMLLSALAIMLLIHHCHTTRKYSEAQEDESDVEKTEMDDNIPRSSRTSKSRLCWLNDIKNFCKGHGMVSDALTLVDHLSHQVQAHQMKTTYSAPTMQKFFRSLGTRKQQKERESVRLAQEETADKATESFVRSEEDREAEAMEVDSVRSKAAAGCC